MVPSGAYPARDAYGRIRSAGGADGIVAGEGEPEEEVVLQPELDDDDEVVTEELAEIYLAQGLRDKSVAIYRKLSLRNPEKSVYFAELIGKIENNIKI